MTKPIYEGSIEELNQLWRDSKQADPSLTKGQFVGQLLGEFFIRNPDIFEEIKSRTVEDTVVLPSGVAVHPDLMASDEFMGDELFAAWLGDKPDPR